MGKYESAFNIRCFVCQFNSTNVGVCEFPFKNYTETQLLHYSRCLRRSNILLFLFLDINFLRVLVPARNIFHLGNQLYYSNNCLCPSLGIASSSIFHELFLEERNHCNVLKLWESQTHC